MPSSDAPVYILIGATGGIGRATAHLLADGGARLVLGARREEPLRALADDLNAEAHPLDATRLEEVQALVDHAVETHGRLDGIANCVGSILLKPAHLTSEEEYRRTVALNLDTAFFTVKTAARAMMSDGGSIALCAAAVGRTGIQNHEAIAAAKAGVAGLTRSAAATYGHRGIRINCVAPGLVDTPLTERITQNEASLRQSEAMHALGRMGRPEDVGRVLAWLLDSEASGWVTGQTIGVDGGLGTVRPRS